MEVFLDPACESCANSWATLKQAAKSYQNEAGYIFRVHPLPFHRHSFVIATVSTGCRCIYPPYTCYTIYWGGGCRLVNRSANNPLCSHRSKSYGRLSTSCEVKFAVSTVYRLCFALSHARRSRRQHTARGKHISPARRTGHIVDSSLRTPLNRKFERVSHTRRLLEVHIMERVWE